ncbi:MAG: 50S ribosomal protein L1 [archaeon]
MEKDTILKAIKSIKEQSKKRNFSQSYDLIINLRNLNLKKPEEKVDLFVTLPHTRGKKTKICGLFGPELYNEGKENCDKLIQKEEFANLKKRDVKNLEKEYDFFLGQANIMPDIAKTFGRTLGAKGKMPNPKAGCIIPPKAQLKPIITKLQKVVRITTKNELVIKCQIGTETMKDEEVVENILAIYNSVINFVPLHDQNIRNVFLKLTMGKPELIGGKA